jgi:hypothetical protein
MRHLLVFLLSLVFSICIISCKKELADVQLAPLTNYYSLQVGNSYTYRLDSTVYLAFGTSIATVSYMAKDSVVSTYNDNTGRTVFLVYRYLTDTLMKAPFAYSSAYSILPTRNTIEVTDANNIHFINLVQPITAGTTWLGNAYIDTKSLTTDLAYMDSWNYTYQNINAPFTVLKGSIDSTITVLGIDETRPDDSPFDPQYFKQRDYAEEVYAKGVGLIYKEFTHWVWQPSDNINPGHYEDGSYGIKMNLVDYDIK